MPDAQIEKQVLLEFFHKSAPADDAAVEFAVGRINIDFNEAMKFIDSKREQIAQLVVVLDRPTDPQAEVRAIAALDSRCSVALSIKPLEAQAEQK